MNKILEYILFRTVLVIITLHAIVPHPHSDELTEEKHFELHKKSNSIFGVIRLVFHESDDESLDNLIFAKYETTKKIVRVVKRQPKKISTFKNTTTIVGKVNKEKIIKCSINNFNKIFFVKLNGLRGPPLFT